VWRIMRPMPRYPLYSSVINRDAWVSTNRVMKIGQAFVGEVAHTRHTRHDFPAAFNDADHCRLRGAASALVRLVIATLVPFPRLPSDVSLVRLHDSVQERALIRVPEHGIARAVHHAPDGRLANAKVAGDLTRAGRLLRVEHQREDHKPAFQRDMRAVENRPNRNRESAGAALALPALSLPIAASVAADLLAHAVGANRTTAPADALKVIDSLFLGLESLEKL